MLSVICFAAEHVVDCHNNNGKQNFIQDVTFIILCFFAGINIWRGIWNLLYSYVDENKQIFLIINGVSWIMLMIFNCVNSLVAKGVFKDNQESGTSCVKLQIQYFYKILKSEETDKNIIHGVNTNDVCIVTSWRVNEAFSEY